MGKTTVIWKKLLTHGAQHSVGSSQSAFVKREIKNFSGKPPGLESPKSPQAVG